MKLENLKETLLNKGFAEEKIDTGISYSKEINNIKLVCYIEPNIRISFISIYDWSNNEVKGTYDVLMTDLGKIKNSAFLLFMKTLKNMPEYVGEKDVHTQIKYAINNTFN